MQRIGLFLTVLVLAANFAQAGLLRKSAFQQTHSDHPDNDPYGIATLEYAHDFDSSRAVVSDTIPKLRDSINTEFDHLSKDPTSYLHSVESEVSRLIHHSTPEDIMKELKKPETLSKLAIHSLTHNDAIDFLDQILCKLDRCTNQDTQMIEHQINQLAQPEVINTLVHNIQKSWATKQITDWLHDKRIQFDKIHRSPAAKEFLKIRGGDTPPNRLTGTQDKLQSHGIKSRIVETVQAFKGRAGQWLQRSQPRKPNDRTHKTS